MFDPLDFPGGIIPSSWWNPGVDAIWVRRFSSTLFYTLLTLCANLMSLTVYRKYGNDTISIVPFMAGHSQLYTANLDVARQVVGGGPKGSWIKPERVSRSMLYVPKYTVASLRLQ